MATAHHNLSDIDLENLPEGQDLSLGIVVARWNAEITEALYQGALDVLLARKVAKSNITRLEVPGTIELTYGCKKLCESTSSLDAIIAIGVVIEGETRHFDYVCQSVTQGITALNVRYNTPVIFCVLTDKNIEQSRARSGGAHGNKGSECAAAALQMAALKNSSL